MSLGPMQILLVLLAVVILFGLGKLPRAMGDLGKGMRAFKKGLKEEDDKTLTDQKDDQS